MYSSCPLYFGRHKSKYFYYQITFYMCYTCCHKNKYHGGGIAEIKRKCIKRRLKIIGKLSFSLPRFYFLFSFFNAIILMYSSCPLYFGRHKSKYFYYQITFYMCYTCCHKNKYHGGGIAEIKRKCIKRRLKIIGKLSFSLPRFYFLFSFFNAIILMYSSCPLYFGRHKSKYFYYQITFYM